jgi:hypothetical protein
LIVIGFGEQIRHGLIILAGLVWDWRLPKALSKAMGVASQ